tara:strand:- start:605 stop:1156 length:552 start_codon:yes stop_codon:yes gene_type:complete
MVCITLSVSAQSIESLGYSVVASDGDIEIRKYEPHLLASVRVAGNFEEAGSKAFRPLFKFITGENTSDAKIAMTAPVIQTSDANEWLISFVMPREYDLESLPVPASAVVEVSSQPEIVMAAMEYSGGWSKKRYLKHEALMKQALASGSYKSCGEPRWARHNDPFTPWFLRKNEILVPLCGSDM